MKIMELLSVSIDQYPTKENEVGFDSKYSFEFASKGFVEELVKRGFLFYEKKEKSDGSFNYKFICSVNDITIAIEQHPELF